MKRLRGKVELWVFLGKRRWTLVVGLIGLGVGVASTLRLETFGLSGLLGAVTFVFGTAVFVSDINRSMRHSRMLHRVDLNPSVVTAGIQRSDIYGSYGTGMIGSDRYLISEKVNRALRSGLALVGQEPQKFSLSVSSKEVAPFVLREQFKSGAVIFNDKKVRFLSDLTEGLLARGERVVVQPTDYFSGLCSNELACSEIRLRNSNYPLLSGLELCTNHGVLEDLQSSKCSNHIGVSTLAMTSDGVLVMPIQARGSAQSPNFATASGSGSIDWDEVRDDQSLSELIAEAASRELREEIGIDSRPEFKVETLPLGYARVLTRGGKPEFFCVSYMNAGSDALRVTRREHHFIADILTFRVDRSDAQSIRESLDRFEEEHPHRFALSLALNLRILRNFLRDEPLEAAAFFRNG